MTRKCKTPQNYTRTLQDSTVYHASAKPPKIILVLCKILLYSTQVQNPPKLYSYFARFYCIARKCKTPQNCTRTLQDSTVWHASAKPPKIVFVLRKILLYSTQVQNPPKFEK